jgi:hypothetical protein
MKKLVILVMVCALALGMTACGNKPDGDSATASPSASASNQPSPTIKPTDNSGANWNPPSAAGLIDFSALDILSEMDSIVGGSVLDILNGLAIPIVRAAEVGNDGVEFYGHFDDSSDADFAWSVISYIITHYAEDSELVRGEEITAPAEVVGRYFSAYFYDADEIPPIPSELSNSIKYDSAKDAYSFAVADGVSATVTATHVFSVLNEDDEPQIYLYVDTEFDGEPYLPLQIALTYTGNKYTRFGLSRVLIAAAGDNNGDPGEYLDSYYNETYEYGVNIPVGFYVTEETEEGVSLNDNNGALIKIAGDWADIGGTQAIQAAYESACNLDGTDFIDSTYDPELGFGVFNLAPNDTIVYCIGAIYGRSIVTVTLVYPLEYHDFYVQIAVELTQELTTMDIPQSSAVAEE